jgi:glutaredoxin 3
MLMKLELYKMTGCPYCGRVERFIRESERTDVEVHNVTESAADQERLIRDGGKDQVPCLFIDGKPLYESGDIIAWLEAHPQAE